MCDLEYVVVSGARCVQVKEVTNDVDGATGDR
jgi:hypothetical protein